ncbi:MAG: alginate O-acetyltransferase [Ketobacteraceae bacterium]|nr:alginate O-acetyltransferase [Ketobacteraceae bacterium]
MKQHSKTVHILYISSFFLMLTAIGLVSAPKVPLYVSQAGGSLVKGEVASEFESLYDEGLPIRSFGMSLWAAVQYSLFKEGKSGVIIGNDDWLFSKEEFFAPEKPAYNLTRNLDTISAVAKFLEQQGVALAIAYVPAKVTIYKDKTARQVPSLFMQSLYDDGLEYLASRSPHVIDLTEPLSQLAQDSLAFFRTDTHWTPAGASLAAKHIAQHVENLELDLPQKEYRTQTLKSESFHGDLTRFLPLSPWFASLMPKPDQLETHATRLFSDDETQDNFDLFGDENVPVVLVGTSYSANPDWNFEGALKQALGCDVMNVAVEGKGPLDPMLSYLQSEDFSEAPPKLIVWEIPVRYLPTTSPAAYMNNGRLNVTQEG